MSYSPQVDRRPTHCGAWKGFEALTTEQLEGEADDGGVVSYTSSTLHKPKDHL